MSDSQGGGSFILHGIGGLNHSGMGVFERQISAVGGLETVDQVSQSDNDNQ